MTYTIFKDANSYEQKWAHTSVKVENQLHLDDTTTNRSNFIKSGRCIDKNIDVFSPHRLTKQRGYE